MTAARDEATRLFGMALKKREDALDEAVALFERAVRVDPEHGPAWICLGGAYEDCGRLEDALHAFQRGVVCNPRSRIGSTLLFFALLDHGDRDGALAEIQRYFSVKQDDAYDMFFNEAFEAQIEQGGPVEEERWFVDALIEVAQAHRGEQLAELLAQLDYPYDTNDGE